MTAIHYFIMYFCLLMCRKTHLHNETDQNMLEKLTWVKVPCLSFTTVVTLFYYLLISVNLKKMFKFLIILLAAWI